MILVLSWLVQCAHWIRLVCDFTPEFHLLFHIIPQVSCLFDFQASQCSTRLAERTHLSLCAMKPWKRLDMKQKWEIPESIKVWLFVFLLNYICPGGQNICTAIGRHDIIALSVILNSAKFTKWKWSWRSTKPCSLNIIINQVHYQKNQKANIWESCANSQILHFILGF